MTPCPVPPEISLWIVRLYQWWEHLSSVRKGKTSFCLLRSVWSLCPSNGIHSNTSKWSECLCSEFLENDCHSCSWLPWPPLCLITFYYRNDGSSDFAAMHFHIIKSLSASVFVLNLKVFVDFGWPTMNAIDLKKNSSFQTWHSVLYGHIDRTYLKVKAIISWLFLCYLFLQKLTGI